MTNRERELASLGFEYAEGIERAEVIFLPNGREVRKTDIDTWEVQPVGDNYWLEFLDVIEAIRCGIQGIVP